MKVCIMQPAYLPWLGYFDRIAQCDGLVFWDHVAFSDKHKDNFVNRNKIRTKDGWQWLTVPVHARFGSRIVEVYAANETWGDKHIELLSLHYPQADWEWLYFGDLNCLANIARHSVCEILKRLYLPYVQIFNSSDFPIPEGKNEALLAMCHHIGATEYLSGPQGRNYLDSSQWEKAGIRVEFHDYEHPVYKQRYEPFIPYMSVIDLIYNEGDKALEILTHGRFGTGRPS